MKHTSYRPLITIAALLAIAFGLFACNHAGAQTVNVTSPVAGGITNQSGTLLGWFGAGSTNSTFQSIYKGAGDALAFAEGNTNGWARVSLEAGYLKTKTGGGGAFANFYIPVSGTNNILGAGFGVAYVNHDWYDATLNARLGDEVPLPYGLQKLFPVYAYVESGGGYNFNTRQGIAQAFTGVSLHYALFRTKAGNTFDLSAGYAIGTISDVPGNVQAFGGSASWNW